MSKYVWKREKDRDRQRHRDRETVVCFKEPLVCLEYLSMAWMGSHLDGEPLSPSLTCSLFIYLFNLFPVLTQTALTATS